MPPRSIRGNVETRIRKAMDPDGEYDAIVLARAGLERLDLLNIVTAELPLDIMLPAPGQAALAIQCRDDAVDRAGRVDQPFANQPGDTGRTCVSGRTRRRLLGPGRSLRRIRRRYVRLRGRVLAIDGGSRRCRIDHACTNRDARHAGALLAQDALARGAADLMAELAR